MAGLGRSRTPVLGWAVVVVVGAVAGLAPAWADDPSPLPDRLERWHSWVESALTWTGVGIDSFFDAHTPDGMELPTEESYGRIRLYPRYDRGDFGLGAASLRIIVLAAISAPSLRDAVRHAG